MEKQDKPAEDATTKLAIELDKWGKLDVEGLSRASVTWIVIVVIGSVIIAAIVGVYLADKSGGGAAVGGTVVVATIGAIAAFVLLRMFFAPVRGVSEAASSTREILGDISQAAQQQASRSRYLEDRLAELNGQLATIPTLQASVIVERERLKERERTLATMAAELESTRVHLKESRARIERQPGHIVWLQNARSLIWALCLIALVWIATGYRARMWRARAEFEREMRMHR